MKDGTYLHSLLFSPWRMITRCTKGGKVVSFLHGINNIVAIWLRRKECQSGDEPTVKKIGGHVLDWNKIIRLPCTISRCANESEREATLNHCTIRTGIAKVF